MSQAPPPDPTSPPDGAEPRTRRTRDHRGGRRTRGRQPHDRLPRLLGQARGQLGHPGAGPRDRADPRLPPEQRRSQPADAAVEDDRRHRSRHHQPLLQRADPWSGRRHVGRRLRHVRLQHRWRRHEGTAVRRGRARPGRGRRGDGRGERLPRGHRRPRRPRATVRLHGHRRPAPPRRPHLGRRHRRRTRGHRTPADRRHGPRGHDPGTRRLRRPRRGVPGRARGGRRPRTAPSSSSTATGPGRAATRRCAGCSPRTPRPRPSSAPTT